MAYHCEYDATNKVLLSAFEGDLTEAAAVEFYEAFERELVASDARASICDLTLVTDLALSSAFLRNLARRQPIMLEASRPHILVAPTTAVYGMMRMYQIVGEQARPHLQVVRTIEEALSLLGVRDPRFEAWGKPTP
jgi:hypothetical protein